MPEFYLIKLFSDKYIGLQWPTQWAPPKSSESEPRSSTDIKLTDLCALMPHGENQSVRFFIYWSPQLTFRCLTVFHRYWLPCQKTIQGPISYAIYRLWYQGFRQTQMLGKFWVHYYVICDVTFISGPKELQEICCQQCCWIGSPYDEQPRLLRWNRPRSFC